VPPPFDANGLGIAWTSTIPVLGTGIVDPSSRFRKNDLSCAFIKNATTSPFTVRCVSGPTKPASFIVSKANDTVTSLDTGLTWERTGVVVQTFAEAKAHCDKFGHIPIIQEVYSIIDPRNVSQFDPDLFPITPTSDGGTPPRIIVSQTMLYAGSHEAVNIQPNGSNGDEDAMGDDDGEPDVLVRCVR
jgi:hypothetical protein